MQQPDHNTQLLVPFDYTSSLIDEVQPIICIGDAPVVVLGELTLVSGPKKTYKSNVCQCMAAALLGGSSDECINFSRQHPEKKYKVMMIDTEQSRADYKRKCCSTLNRAGLSTDKVDDCLIAYAWRGKEPSDMVKALPVVVAQNHPDVVIIDGIADFMVDINNVQESRSLTSLLLSLCDNMKCAIVCVIHQNQSNAKDRGHIGTLLGNKVFGYIALKRKQGAVSVSASDGCRGKAFREFTIVYDDKIHGVTTLHKAFNTPSASDQKKATESAERGQKKATKNAERGQKKATASVPAGVQKKQNPGQKTIDLAKQIPAIIANSGKAWLPACAIVRQLLMDNNIDPKNETTARRALTFARDNNIVVQPKEKGPYMLPAPQLDL